MCDKSFKIGENIFNNIDFLKRIAKSKSPQKQKHSLKKATTGELLAIVEAALNIVKSRFKLTTRQKHRIVPHAEYIRRLARIRSERSAKRLVQKGAGIPLAAILTPIIIEAIRQISIR